MIWFQSTTRSPSFAPWVRHRLEASEWMPEEFARYRVRIGHQIFEEHSREFQQVYDRERIWQRLKHT